METKASKLPVVKYWYLQTIQVPLTSFQDVQSYIFFELLAGIKCGMSNSDREH